MNHEEFVTVRQRPWWMKPFSSLWWRLQWTWFIYGWPVHDIDILTIEVPDDSEIARLMKGPNDG